MNSKDKAIAVLDILDQQVAKANNGATAAAIASTLTATAQVHATLAVADQLEQLVRVTQSHHFAAGSL